MKRVKLMFTAITVFAVVAGALAFKSKTYTNSYCASTTSGGTCSTISFKKPGTTSDPLFYTSTTTSNCSSQSCTLAINLTTD